MDIGIKTKPHLRRTGTAARLPSASAESHHAASFTERDMRAWTPMSLSADSDLLPELPAIRSRARDIDRNHGIARGGIQTIVDNVVGTGLRLSARPNYIALGRDKKWAEQWALNTEALYHEWAWSTACHAGDTLTWDQLTALALRSQLMNGEACALPLWLPDRGDGFSTKLQMIEADRLENPEGQPDSTTLHGGIRFDQYGAPVGYYFRRNHPGENLYLNAVSPSWQFVPRRTPFGRLRVLHVFDTERSAQSRGKPLLTAVLPQFKNADRYFQYEMQAALFNAMIAGFITTAMDQDSILEMLKSGAPDQNGLDQMAAYTKLRNENAVALKGGTLIPLFPGDEIKPFMPQRPAAAFGNFVESVYRIIAVGLDMPYETLMKDYSKTTYSSARSSMLEAWRSFNRRRDWAGTQWCDPIYMLFLEEMVNAGKIEAPDFYEKRQAYARCKWIGPGRGWVDPVKEAQAAILRIRGQVSTREDECAEQGLDWREVADQLKTEDEYFTQLGLNPDLSGATVESGNGAGGNRPGGGQAANDDAELQEAATSAARAAIAEVIERRAQA